MLVMEQTVKRNIEIACIFFSGVIDIRLKSFAAIGTHGILLQFK